MASQVSLIEEIPRNDVMVPQIRLKIISLNLNERGESLTPPPPLTAGERGRERQRCGRQLVVRHQLQSYDHLLHNLPLARLQGPAFIPPPPPPRHRQPPSSTHTMNNRPTNHKDASNDKTNSPFDKYNSTFVVFVQGMNNAMSGDKEKIVNTLVQLLSKHAVSVLRKEHYLFTKKTMPPESSLNQVVLRGALLALNELLDEGVLDITRSQMVRLGQCLTVTVYFHGNLTELGRQAWHSSYGQIFRDAWMSFGCLGAMFLFSSMRQRQ